MPVTGARISRSGSTTMSDALRGSVSRSRVSIVNHETDVLRGVSGCAPSSADSWKPMPSMRSATWWSTTGPVLA